MEWTLWGRGLARPQPKKRGGLEEEEDLPRVGGWAGPSPLVFVEACLLGKLLRCSLLLWVALLLGLQKCLGF